MTSLFIADNGDLIFTEMKQGPFTHFPTQHATNLSETFRGLVREELERALRENRYRIVYGPETLAEKV